MKPPRNARLGMLAGLAGLALLVAWAVDANDEAMPARAAAQAHAAPRAANVASAASAAVNTRPPMQMPAPTSAQNPAQTPPSRADKSTTADRAAALAALDTALIAGRVEPASTATNAFAPKRWYIAPPAPPPAEAMSAPAPPPPPQAPPLPFKYMGSMQETPERRVWYLMNGDRLVVAGSGDVIEATYRLDAAEGGQLRFTYLPLQQRQTLSIGVPP